jgi:hypothetical protein
MPAARCIAHSGPALWVPVNDPTPRPAENAPGLPALDRSSIAPLGYPAGGPFRPVPRDRAVSCRGPNTDDFLLALVGAVARRLPGSVS